MSTRLDPKKNAWMQWPETQAVMDALTAKGGDARFVGGAVRNALLGEKVTDIDIATPLTPDEVTKRLVAAGLQAVPTGIEHGTVTAVANGKPFEVTTLRRDVSTDGRRAVVAYTSDWREDASRRDFTMNALYANTDGEVFDFHGGVEDLKAGRVRFVGDPATRIYEDYLRILRLFRFHAYYGKGRLDKGALHASEIARKELKKLSGERIQKECLKLLSARDPRHVVNAMIRRDILPQIFPRKNSFDRFQKLVHFELRNHCKPDGILRLAALLPNQSNARRIVADRWKLSNADRMKLFMIFDIYKKLGVGDPTHQAKYLVYKFDRATFIDAVRLHSAEQPRKKTWRFLIRIADQWSPPKFPISGRDAMASGVKEGPDVGKILGELEQWWIENDFKPDRAALLARLKQRQGRA